MNEHIGPPSRRDPAAAEPIDPDTAAMPGSTPASPAADLSVWGAIAAGGALGALARWASGQWYPTRQGVFPWTTFGINAIGCALIGAMMVLVTDVYPAQRLIRPFVVTGVLGGFTTFSTYSVDTLHLLDAGHWVTAVGNVFGTLTAAIGAVTITTRLTRRVVSAARR